MDPEIERSERRHAGGEALFDAAERDDRRLRGAATDDRRVQGFIPTFYLQTAT
jgi:hypothetical protein